MPRRRLRTLTLWTGTTLCVLIAAVFVASGWWQVAVGIPARGVIGIRGGCVWPNPSNPSGVYFHNDGWYRWNRWILHAGPSWNPLRFPLVMFPLYVVFATVAIPTFLLWRFGPKPVKPGHCRCGYNLTGNTSGVCSECGVEVQT